MESKQALWKFLWAAQFRIIMNCHWYQMDASYSSLSLRQLNINSAAFYDSYITALWQLHNINKRLYDKAASQQLHNSYATATQWLHNSYTTAAYDATATHDTTATKPLHNSYPTAAWVMDVRSGGQEVIRTKLFKEGQARTRSVKEVKVGQKGSERVREGQEESGKGPRGW